MPGAPVTFSPYEGYTARLIGRSVNDWPPWKPPLGRCSHLTQQTVVSDEYGLYCGGERSFDDVPTRLELDPDLGAWVITVRDN